MSVCTQSRIRIQIVVKAGNNRINRRIGTLSYNENHLKDSLHKKLKKSLSSWNKIFLQSNIDEGTKSNSRQNTIVQSQQTRKGSFMVVLISGWGGNRTNQHLQLINRDHTHLNHNHVYTHKEKKKPNISRNRISRS